MVWDLGWKLGFRMDGRFGVVAMDTEKPTKVLG